MMLAGRTWLMAVAAVGATACEPDIINPTGSCEAPNDGGRAGYHVPGDSTWLPDCDNPLRREYWRVFATTQTSAYTIPRLDGEPRLQPACTDTAHAFAPLVARYGLCASAMNQEEVMRVNDMAPLDALILTHFLHGQLVFTIGDSGLRFDISPYAMPSDVIDACALHPQTNSADFAALCKSERDSLASPIGVGTYDGPAVVELAAALNELYGITP